MIEKDFNKCYHNGKGKKEGKTVMASNLKAVKKYQSKMDSFKIRPSAEDGAKIRKYAADMGKSIQGLFLLSVNEYMVLHPAPEAETEAEGKKGKED